MAASPHVEGGGQIPRKAMYYLVHHVILPPQLPQNDDYSIEDEEWILRHALEAFKLFRDIVQKEQADGVEPVAIHHAFCMLSNLARIYNSNATSACMNEKELQNILIYILDRSHEDVAPVPLYVHSQNAGILVSLTGNEKVHFELFELSPLNNAVMSNAGRLQRTFPGCAIAVPRDEARNPAFLQTLTDTLAKMSRQPAYGTMSKVKKAGQMHQEDRDTIHPKMVTELFAAYLRSVGEMAEVSSIRKNTRQEVLWENARSPWHRSALWLLIRVSLQLFLSREESKLANPYKNYMLFVKAKVTRRRLKLGLGGHPGVLQFIDNALSRAENRLQEQWSHFQSVDSVSHNLADLKCLPAKQDTVIHLEGLDLYLEAIANRENITQIAKLPRSCPLPDFTSPLNKSFKNFPSTTPKIFKLLKFEARAKFPGDYIFRHYGRWESFAVQYFNQSKEQQDTLSDIERRATISRDAKQEELKNKRNDYETHLRQYNRLECRPCERCKHQGSMDSLKIELHEWPLPDDKDEAKNVVFELLVPKSFGSWRDSTIFVLADVFRLRYVSDDRLKKRYTIEENELLRGSFKPYGKRRRLNIKSVISAPVSEVCVKNGMTFRYFDDVKGYACMFKLSKPSKPLQQFLDNIIESSQLSNTAIATQSKCPQSFSLEEYKGLASLPAGNRLKWQNVLKDLASPAVDFMKEDTVLVVLQCIQHAGRREAQNTLRETHSILDDQRFSAALLSNLLDASSALSCFISIANRVLALSSTQSTQRQALNILSTAREISINWVEVLKRKAERATEDRVRDDFLSKSAFIALICADSFNMHSQNLREILSAPEQAAIMIRTAIIIQEGRHKIPTSSSLLAALLYYRWKRLCLRAIPILVDQVLVQKNPALDKAITMSWASYQSVGQWKALGTQYGHWLYGASAPDEYGNTLAVQFSVLTGELLVNGAPLNRLPEEYEQNPAYLVLFGRSTIEAMPSSMFAGHELHFNIGNQQDTLPETSLLIPPYDFVHWYNVAEDCVEFRPRDSAWLHSDENWMLHRVGQSKAWRLTQADKSLVNINSTTAQMFSAIFKTLEDAPYIHIELPRIQLGFSARIGDASIKSHQHRGMSVHEDQSIGTLVGLFSKLVLKSDKADARDKIYNVVCTQIYEIDRQLGRILDNGTLTSKLVLAYLQGLTSFCLPDPLTGSTGTNAALSILRSAAVRSFPSVSQEEVDLLVEIASLTPRREFYPKHLSDMQSVHWSPNLGFLAQHSGYYESVRSLFKHFERSNWFHPEQRVRLPALHEVNRVLLQREKTRSAFVRSWDFGAECYTVKYDSVYSPRDRLQNSDEGLQALSLSTMVFQDRCNPQVRMDDDIGLHLWRFLQQNCAGLYSNPSSSGGFLKYLRALKGSAPPNKYQVMMWLATLSFAEDPDMTILQFLASFFICPRMRTIQIPHISFFVMNDGFELRRVAVRDKASRATREFADAPEAKLTKHNNETDRTFYTRRARIFDQNCDQAIRDFSNALIEQWPCEIPVTPANTGALAWGAYINIDQAMEYVRSLFQTCYRNHCLREYLERIGSSVPRTSKPLDALTYMPRPAPSVSQRGQSFVSGDDVFSGAAPSAMTTMDIDITINEFKKGSKGDASPLPSLLAQLDELTSCPFEANYMMGMRDSLSALDGLQNGYDLDITSGYRQELFIQHQYAWVEIVDAIYSVMQVAVTKQIEERLKYPNTRDTKSTLPMQHFPQPCPTFFLQRLARKRWRKLSEDWKKCLIQYGVAITQLQRANRLLDAIGNPGSLKRELKNPGHENWDPYEYPESLLLEIENGILIRNVQEEIASQMRNPPSGNNAVMQLNMGEGKSSVIVPIVAASLADTTRLVRVVVAKPQSKQMLQMLVAKLGGLLDRQIYHLPFSRAIKIDQAGTRAIDELLKECMNSGGILLTQPENILSFMLMGIESCISGDSETSQALIKTLSFLDANSRDIVDESDENFSVKFELLYTIGLQRPIQYSPERWICVQDVLEIFRKIVPEVKRQFPSSIEVHHQPNRGFPRTRILRVDAQERIIIRVAEEICLKGLRAFPIVRQRKDFREAVFSYITEAELSSTVISIVEDDDPKGFWANSRETLLLLRGLLAGGVLSFCFGHKRWRVDYGLDASREPATQLALPFRAKDSPTPRSEFSHPEVVIVLTQLSYYYGGLSNDELTLAFRHLLNSDQADVEFQAWVQCTTRLSNEFKQLSGINLDDTSTCEEEIFPHFRFSQGAINYFLSNKVFPKEMKEFPFKLSASGWDIGKIKTHPTTGFSGTNDSRAVLPLSVDQLDLDEQKHTNALVLENLLKPENSVELMHPQVDEEISDAKMLLNKVIGMDPPVRVILDVGAQILELDNLGVAREWLSRIQDLDGTEAVVFFNVHDELSVLDRKGRIEPLQVSPYINQLDLCLVFLDEAHTRGTELKLPRHYRAAVTLGANLTKDRLVQACMRMRLLGEGQSVVFCVQQEIALKIQGRLPNVPLTVQRLPNLEPTVEPIISVSHILAWAITETWDDAKRNILLWAAQGRRHERHKRFWGACRANGNVLTKKVAKLFLEDEARSLEDRYRPLQSHDHKNEPDDAITRRCRQFNDLRLNAAVLQEEQERELSPEIEQERQDERPPLAEPEKHSLHQDVRNFVTTGKIIKGSNGYMGAFTSLKGTSAASVFDVSQFRPGLLVSADFARTVRVKNSRDKSDGYQRSVQWILTGSQTPNSKAVHMMIISPYEANELLPEIKVSTFVALHLYAPRPNLGYRSLDKLDLYTVPESLSTREIPRRLITELNLFAGQLYLGAFDEYIEVCKFLGLAWEPAKDGEVIAADGFIFLDHAGRVGGESGFHASPVEFFKIFLTKIRRNCEAIDKTHMGHILDNRLLSPEDFD
ncbi:hypothetical protein HD806DRAFT_552951 [Xylariaceae sp. AK1471]|nr:hypothetical protein HD806DRAFT_552951 [Xylariaceae sp. AK1471]